MSQEQNNAVAALAVGERYAVCGVEIRRVV